jgi:hypothetical protein
MVRQLRLLGKTKFVHHDDHSKWTFPSISRQWTIWTPSPEVGRQAISTFLHFWVEEPARTGGIFLVPCILQRQWGHMSHYVTETGIYNPLELPWGLRYNSLIPFVLLVCFPHVRCLPPAESAVESTAAAHGMDQ